MRLKNNNEKLRQFEFIDGWRHLKEEVQHFGETNQLTQLVVNLTDVDPDDAFSSVLNAFMKISSLISHVT